MSTVKRKRGRPIGTVLSQETKDKISKSKTGQKQTEYTKAKISAGVKRKHNTISIERVISTNLEGAAKVIQNDYVNVYIPQLDGRNEGNWMRLHVAMMEQHLGRKLKRGEEVHHWGDKDDNRFEMLTLCPNRKMHVELDRVKKLLIK